MHLRGPHQLPPRLPLTPQGQAYGWGGDQRELPNTKSEQRQGDPREDPCELTQKHQGRWGVGRASTRSTTGTLHTTGRLHPHLQREGGSPGSRAQARCDY